MKSMSKLLLPVSSLVLAISMAACSSNSIPSSASFKSNADFSKISSFVKPGDVVSKAGDFQAVQKPNGDVNYIVDVGHGKKSGASLTVKLNLNDGFKTKAFSNGVKQGLKSNIQGVEFYLLNKQVGVGGLGGGQGPGSNAFDVHNTGDRNFIAGPLFLDNTFAKISALNSGGTTSITFTNIAPLSTTNAPATQITGPNSNATDVFVLAAAQNVNSLALITSNPQTNITNKTFGSLGTPHTSQIFLTDPTQGVNASRGWYAASTTGGDTSNTGKINVTNETVTASPYVIADSSAGALTIPLTLLDAQGANADSVINVSDGNALPAAGVK